MKAFEGHSKRGFGAILVQIEGPKNPRPSGTPTAEGTFDPKFSGPRVAGLYNTTLAAMSAKLSSSSFSAALVL